MPVATEMRLRPSFGTSSDWLVRRRARTVAALMPPGSAGACATSDSGLGWLLCSWPRDRYGDGEPPEETTRVTVQEAWIWAHEQQFREWVTRRTAEHIRLLEAMVQRELARGANAATVASRLGDPLLDLRRELDQIQPREPPSHPLHRVPARR